MNKREDYISWDEYFMGIAVLSGMRSKDPSTMVGSCIVDEHKKIVGIGYNGMPRGCSDDDFPWGRDGEHLDTKYPYVVHAEMNAILNSSKNLHDCTIFTGLFPCNECAKAIVQSGIKHVVYLSDKHHHSDSAKASRKILQAAQVEYVQFLNGRDRLELDLSFD